MRKRDNAVKRSPKSKRKAVKPPSRRLRRDLTPELINRFFEAIDTPVALACAMLFNSGEHEQLARKTIDPRDYADAESFRSDYHAVRFLSKYTGLETGIDTTEVALSEFLRCERKCQVVNDQLLNLYIEDPIISLNSENDWRFSRIVSWLQCKISSCLGELDWSEIFDACRFGPGATTRIGGTKTSAYEKFQGTPHTTQGALPYCLALSELWENFFHRFEVVPGNAVTFVLKNAKTARPIAIEPDMNQFIQLGVGGVFRGRLRRFGVDIRDQTRNQQLAYRGSRFGSHCTVDLKSASDLMCRYGVELMLPTQWFRVLDDIRSHRYTLDGCVKECHKFSSMGNGFTFPLQTLIFWALACLACKMSNVGSTQVSVYGDDVIVPPEAFHTFLRLLNLFGFEPNSEKSFGDGQFRESCGKDYFNGLDCQPLYLKEPVLEALSLVKFANRVQRLSSRNLHGYGRDRRFFTLWQYCVAELPRDLQRCRIPEGYGDGGLVASFEEACPQRAGYGRLERDGRARPATWVEGFTYSRWVFVPSKYEMADIEGTRRVALFTCERIKSPVNGWLAKARLSSLEEISGYDAVQDFEGSDGCPTGHVVAIHRRKGQWERRTGVARNWPSLGGWY